MNATPLPDRNERLGGRWTSPDLVDDLLKLSAIERGTAHVAAGWIAKVPNLDAKVVLGGIFEECMKRSIGLRQSALALLQRDEAALRVRRAWVEPLAALDACSESEVVFSRLTNDLPAFLLSRYRVLLSRLDPLLDARTIKTARTAIAELAEAKHNGALLFDSIFTDALVAAWSSNDGEPVALDDLLWQPLDRVPIPARPAERPRPQAGARAHLRHLSRRDPSDLAIELNDNVMSELCAMELMARCSYEHPDLSWSNHLSLAAHAADEARHTAIFRRLIEQHGFCESQLPQHGANYEYAYAFPECDPGSKHELIWRLLIVCTVLEALAIDKLPVEIASRDVLGPADLARALDYISIDELFHTENGLRLTRQLCEKYGLDPMLERELVHGRFFGRQRKVRAEYLAADTERAAREIAILEAPDPDGLTFQSRTEVELRRRASFTEEECEQVNRWGYNPLSPPSAGKSNGSLPHQIADARQEA